MFTCVAGRKPERSSSLQRTTGWFNFTRAPFSSSPIRFRRKIKTLGEAEHKEEKIKKVRSRFFCCSQRRRGGKAGCWIFAAYCSLNICLTEISTTKKIQQDFYTVGCLNQSPIGLLPKWRQMIPVHMPFLPHRSFCKWKTSDGGRRHLRRLAHQQWRNCENVWRLWRSTAATVCIHPLLRTPGGSGRSSQGKQPSSSPASTTATRPKEFSVKHLISCILVNLYSNHLCLFGIKLWRKFLNYE